MAASGFGGRINQLYCMKNSKTESKSKPGYAPVASVSTINTHAAGIDVGSRKMFVSVAGGPPAVFGCCTGDLRQLVDYLRGQQVTTVAMEATGVYWLCLYEQLEEDKVETLVVNGAHVKALPGRKSDMQDCQWLATLHAHGLLRSGFVPPAEIRRLRDYKRIREDLIRMASAHVLHMHQAMERLNLKIHTVISSVIGWSGQRMVRSIVEGERNPAKLAALCDEQILTKKRIPLLKALEGNWKAEHLFALKIALENWDFCQRQIKACEEQMEPLLKELAGSKPVPEMGKAKELRNNAAQIPQLRQTMGRIYGADLTKIPGPNEYTVMLLVSEIGVDLQKWRSVKAFTAWLGLAPATRQSGKRRRPEKRHGGTAGRIFCLAAQSMARAKKSWLGSFYRRLSATRSKAVALKATARKIAMLFYLVLTKGWAYVEAGLEQYDLRYRQMQMRRLEALARELKVQLSFPDHSIPA